MKKVIIYKSKYGTTERYAKWLAEELDCESVSANNAKKLNFRDYDVVILGGGLYGPGGIAGAGILKKRLNALEGKKIIVFTVGLANPAITDYKNIIGINFNAEQQKKIKFFHIRGGINYKKLTPLHKLMMSMLKSMIKKKKESELTSDDKMMLETYGKEIDFTKKEYLMEIVEYCKLFSEKKY